MSQYEKFKKCVTKLCNEYTNKNAIVYMHEDGNDTYTSYGQIMLGCEVLKDMLDEVGIVAGDRVAVIAPHSPQAVLASLGLEYANVTVVLMERLRRV